MTDLLMLADAPWMAAVVMAVAQPFAQLRDITGFPPYAPLVVALVVSILLAIHWVSVEQKTAPAQSILVVPVVAMMLFSASIGANNVVKAAASGGPGLPGAKADGQKLEERNQLLEKQVEIQSKKIEILTSAASGDRRTSRDPSAERGDVLGWMFGWLAADAHAQPTPAADESRLSVEQKKELAELEREQQEVERAKRELDARSNQPDGDRRTTPLWKSF